MDNNKPKTIYTNRGGIVNGKRKFEIPLPVSPEQLKVLVFNEKNGWKKANDPTFRVSNFGISRLKTFQVWMNEDTKEFLEFAQQFSENAGILDAGRDGTMYQSRSGKFKILYLDQIISKKTGKVLSTPARISNKTAIIEVSKAEYSKYSVPMRLVILTHEYSHFYLNKDIRNEMQADLNGLYYYYGLGYSPVEAHRAFLTVFSKADTAQNELRYQMIKKYSKDYMEGKIAHTWNAEKLPSTMSKKAA
jgi:hypothetical protein